MTERETELERQLKFVLQKGERFLEVWEVGYQDRVRVPEAPMVKSAEMSGATHLNLAMQDAWQFLGGRDIKIDQEKVA